MRVLYYKSGISWLYYINYRGYDRPAQSSRNLRVTVIKELSRGVGFFRICEFLLEVYLLLFANCRPFDGSAEGERKGKEVRTIRIVKRG